MAVVPVAVVTMMTMVPVVTMMAMMTVVAMMSMSMSTVTVAAMTVTGVSVTMTAMFVAAVAVSAMAVAAVMAAMTTMTLASAALSAATLGTGLGTGCAKREGQSGCDEKRQNGSLERIHQILPNKNECLLVLGQALRLAPSVNKRGWERVVTTNVEGLRGTDKPGLSVEQ